MKTIFQRLYNPSDPIKVIASLTILIAFVVAVAVGSLLSVSCEVIWAPDSTTVRPAPEAIEAAVRIVTHDK